MMLGGWMLVLLFLKGKSFGYVKNILIVSKKSSFRRYDVMLVDI